jgi:small-conductance mechanosensitive channel
MNAAAAAAPLGGSVGEWLNRLLSVGTLTELAVLAVCLALSWALVRLLRGAAPRPNSIWFGDHVADGVLFPVVALGAALLMRLLSQVTAIKTSFAVVVPALVALLIIRVGVRVLRVAFPRSGFVHTFERTLSWVVWIGLALWLTGLLPLVVDELDAMTWQLGGVRLSVRSILEGLLTALLVVLLVLWVSAAIEARLLAGAQGRSASELSVRKMGANAVRAILLVVGMLVALSAAGIPLGALGVVGGAVGVGIGFGLQKLAANYVSGFVILAERSLRIGDMVRVDNFEGRITDINTRYTVIQALSGRESIVPNEMLITSRIENLSLANPNVLQSTVVQVAYGTDVEPVMARLAAVAAAVPRVLADPAPAARLTNFASDGLELTLFFWIDDPHNGTANVRSDVNLAILRELEALGVEIPFPQRVLHVRGGAALPDGTVPAA